MLVPQELKVPLAQQGSKALQEPKAQLEQRELRVPLVQEGLKALLAQKVTKATRGTREILG